MPRAQNLPVQEVVVGDDDIVIAYVVLYATRSPILTDVACRLMGLIGSGRSTVSL
jgi:hypothetical protein